VDVRKPDKPFGDRLEAELAYERVPEAPRLMAVKPRIHDGETVGRPEHVGPGGDRLSALGNGNPQKTRPERRDDARPRNLFPHGRAFTLSGGVASYSDVR
jgi:hypothetical protein